MAVLCSSCQSGAAGTNGEQPDEAAAQAATCASLLERHSGVAVEPINPEIFRSAMRDPRLAERSTASVFLLMCQQVAKRRGLSFR